MHVIIVYTIKGISIELSNGTTYSGDIAISINEVGEADSEAVLCRTDLTTCCGVSEQGLWIYPNGSTKVGNEHSGDGIFRSRGDMVVRLHRRNNTATPTGQYCCEVATVDNPDARICITLSKSLF